jgi:hypothetical protein
MYGYFSRILFATVGPAQITPPLPNNKGSLKEGPFFIFAIEAGFESDRKQVHSQPQQRVRRDKRQGQILPQLRTLAGFIQPTTKPRFDDGCCIRSEEVIHVITMATYVPVHTII